MEPTNTPAPLTPCELPAAEDLSPTEAKTALDRLYAQAACDPRSALANGHHPQHAAAVRCASALHARYAERPDAEETPLTRACAEGLARADARRDMLADDTATELDRLHELGFQGEGFTGDPAPWKLNILRMQRHMAEGSHGVLIPLLESALRSLDPPADVRAQFNRAADSTLDLTPEMRDLDLERILAWVAQASKKRFVK